MNVPGIHAIATVALFWFAWGLNFVIVDANQQNTGRQKALHHLFQSLDKDGDGQIEVDEVLKYIQVRQESSDLRVDGEQAAAEHFMAIDSNDGDSTVSEQELLRSLTNKLSGTSVENWVQYGLGLPQYRENFIQNAVTVLDFPLFLEQRQLLEQDLQITSVLHQRQILRAMHAIILGIGNAPYTVQNVRHEVDIDGAMLIAWDPPEAGSHPPIRQLTISRSCLGSGCHWEIVGTVPADASHMHDATAALQPSDVLYRVATWSPVGRSTHVYSVAASTAHPSSPQAFLDSVGVVARPRASSSTPWPAAAAVQTDAPPPPPPVDQTVTARDVGDEQSTFVRSITGIVVMLAAAGLLLQLLWTGAPLQADPSATDALDLGSAPGSGSAPGDARSAPEGGAVPEARSLRHMSRSALTLSRRTVSWIQTISLGSSSQTAGSGHSASSSERMRTTSGRSELLSSTPEDAGEEPRAQGLDACGSMHALSAQDLAAVGCPVSTPVLSNRGASGGGNGGIRSSVGNGSVGNGGIRSRRSGQPGAAECAEGRRSSPGSAEARGSRHRGSTATAPPRPQSLQRPQSHESLAGGGARPIRRTQKVLEKCNMQECPYRPRTVVSALLRPTAEFHYCYRCQSEFCVNHMAWITHGKVPLGKCPLDARCICELCWAELERHGQPLPIHGRKPAKSSSFFAHTRQPSDPASPMSRIDSPAASPVLVSPRSLGSEDHIADHISSPPLRARVNANNVAHLSPDAQPVGTSSKAKLRFKWPFRRK